MKFPYKIKFESRINDVPKWLPLATSLGAVVVAFIISGIVLGLIGGNPFRVYRYFFTASFGSWGAFSDILVKATPLILIGLGCAVAFKMNILNIGAEGQYIVGALAAAAPIVGVVRALPRRDDGSL